MPETLELFHYLNLRNFCRRADVLRRRQAGMITDALGGQTEGSRAVSALEKRLVK
jgi:hypothetical protein